MKIIIFFKNYYFFYIICMYKLEVKVQNMKKLYEYEIVVHLNYQFIKRISINEDTKTLWFELIVIDTKTNEEDWLIKQTNDLSAERTTWKIKDFLKLLAKANIWTPQEVLEYIKQGRLNWQDWNLFLLNKDWEYEHYCKLWD